MRKQTLLYLSELLAERGLISSLEENAVKRIISCEQMQGSVSFRDGAEVGESGNL